MENTAQYSIFHVKGNIQTERNYSVGDDGKMFLVSEEVGLIDVTLVEGDHIVVYVNGNLVEERKI